MSNCVWLYARFPVYTSIYSHIMYAHHVFIFMCIFHFPFFTPTEEKYNINQSPLGFHRNDISPAHQLPKSRDFFLPPFFHAKQLAQASKFFISLLASETPCLTGSTMWPGVLCWPCVRDLRKPWEHIRCWAGRWEAPTRLVCGHRKLV